MPSFNFRLMDLCDSTNELVNQKILLYRWIDPRHLEIEVGHPQVEDAIECFRAIPRRATPTEKILCIMDGVEKIHQAAGRDVGQDGMLPLVIYCIIKSAVPDIYLEIQFVVLYRRKILEQCCPDCTHNLDVHMTCSCLRRRMYCEEEATYYLTSIQAAVDFIKRMEYYDLRISEAEFDNNIADAMGLMGDGPSC